MTQYQDSIKSGWFKRGSIHADEVVSDDDKRGVAEQTIIDYFKDNHTEAGVKQINQFIADYNKAVPGAMIDFTLNIDDKGNIFKRENGSSTFTKVYAKDVDKYDWSRKVSKDDVADIASIIANDTNSADMVSNQKFLKLVTDLQKGGKDVSREDIDKAYKIISEGGITPAEQKMFDALVNVNEDIGVSHIASIGKTLIYKRDETYDKIDHSTGEIDNGFQKGTEALSENTASDFNPGGKKGGGGRTGK